MPNSQPSAPVTLNTSDAPIPARPIILSQSNTANPGEAVIVSSIPQTVVGGGGAASFTVIDPGSGYTAATAILTGDGINATANVVVAGGVVTGLTLTAAGSGYTYMVVAISGDGGGAKAYAILTNPTNPVISRMALYWSLNPLPTDAVALSEAPMQVVRRDAQEVSSPTPPKATFTEEGLAPSATYYFAVVASNN